MYFETRSLYPGSFRKTLNNQNFHKACKVFNFILCQKDILLISQIIQDKISIFKFSSES